LPALATTLDDALRAWTGPNVDLGSLGLAWARAMPVVLLVPAFGLRALPRPAQALMGLGLAACIAPVLGHGPAFASNRWLVEAVTEVMRGLPVALAAAIPLWAATTAGGVADAIRAAQDTVNAPTVEGRATPLGVPLSLLACAIFLATGGPARIAHALAFHPLGEHPLLAAVGNLVDGIGLAVAIGVPLLAAGVVADIAAALVARAASPAQVHALLAPLRALGMLAVMGIVFDRLAAVLAHAVQAAP
jgi:type III secretory pathway component EscT